MTAVLALLGAAAGCADEPDGSRRVTGGTVSAMTGPAPTLARDAAGLALLSSTRASLYSSLADASARTPELTVDVMSTAVLSLGLDWVGPKGNPADDAQAFINTFQKLLDPRVLPSEYERATSRAPCSTTVTFDRYFSGVQVAGSQLTFHFDGRGHLIWVTNGVAPVPAVFVPVTSGWSLPGASDLGKMIGKAPPQSLRRVKTFVPMHDGSGLFQAEVAAWVDNGSAFAAIAIGDVAVSRRLDGMDEGTGRSGSSSQTLAGTDTDVPDMKRYNAIGGVTVSAFPAERNPLESAYRFLEEHATLFHTGAARCQYVPLHFEENPTLPGIYTVKLQQLHGPYRVLGAELVLRLEAIDRVHAVIARARGNIEVNTQATLTANDAVDLANAALGGAPPAWKQAVDEALAAAPRTELVVFPRFLDSDLKKQTDHLAWRVDRGSFTMLFDAQTGARLYATSSRHAARVVRDAGGAGVAGILLGYHTISVDGAIVSTTPAPHTDILPGRDGIPGGLPMAVEAYNALLARNGHLGMNGRGGGDFLANANVNIEFGGCPNAFFDSYVTWNAYLCPGEATADIAGHELTHGVIASTTGLAMADQSGAINEAYADLLGDLADPTRNHLIGDTAASGSFRNLLRPDLSSPPPPMHFSGYVPRTPAACAGSVFPWDCDFGFVHSNSGIINRAHRLLSDGVAGSFTGIGDAKLERLGLAVMTSHLPSSATMHEVAGATRDLCETFVATGVTELATPARAPFTSADCDAVTNAFRLVGLDPSMTSGWSEPALGFSGTDTLLPPGPSGISLFADYLVSTPMPPSTSILGIVATTAFNFTGLPTTVGGELFPIGTPVMTHRIDWTSIYGIKPQYATSVQFPATCTPAPVSTATSATFTRGFDTGEWTGAATVTVGSPAAASLAGTCVLGPPGRQLIEMLDGAGNVIKGPGSDITHTITHWFLFIPVDFNARARIVTVPTGAASGSTRDMSGSVALNWDLGRTERVRWRYEFVAGSSCTPR
jgi:Zn-dependent metalloprotease